MPFGTLTSSTIVYEPRKPGIYERAGISIGAPRDELRFTAGRPNSKTKKVSMAVTRVKQKDFTPPGSTSVVREESNISVGFQVPSTGSFSAAEILALVQDCTNVLTALLLSRLYSGEV